MPRPTICTYEPEGEQQQPVDPTNKPKAKVPAIGAAAMCVMRTEQVRDLIHARWTPTIFTDLAPKRAEIMDYVQRIGARPATARVQAKDAELAAAQQLRTVSRHCAGARPLTSAPASGAILKKNGTDSSEIIATAINTG